MTTQPEPAAAWKLTYSAEILDKDLLAAAEDFAACMQPEIATSLFGRKGMSQIAAARRAVEDRLASPFSIMVVGDFKRGKSTLINALVGQAVAPVDVQPETISINRIEYAEEFTARVQTKDGGLATIAREDLKRERLQPLLRGMPAPLRHLRVGAPRDMLRKVTLIDTPGLGDLFAEFDQDVRQYAAAADTIIYVLSATSPLSQSEQAFLLDAIAPRHFPKVFFVINSMDLIGSDEDQFRLMDQIRQKLEHTMPGASLYAISALDEWCRVSGGDRPRPERADSLARSFAAFRRDLDDAIDFRARYYLLDRAALAFSETLDLAEDRARGVESALQHDQEELESAVHALEQRQQTKSKEFQAASEALEHGFERLRRDAEGWMSVFMDRVQSDVVQSLKNYTAAQIRQHFPFFLRERMRKALDACMTAHQPEIAKLIDEYAVGLDADAARSLPAKFTTAIPIPEGWSALKTAEYVADAIQVGVLFQIGLGILTRQSSQTDSGPAIEEIARNFPGLRDGVRAQTREAYNGVKDKLVADWTQRYQQELEARLGDMKRAVELRESGGQRVEQAKAKLAEVRELVAGKKAFLEEFRPRVWSGLDPTREVA